MKLVLPSSYLASRRSTSILVLIPFIFSGGISYVGTYVVYIRTYVRYIPALEAELRPGHMQLAFIFQHWLAELSLA